MGFWSSLLKYGGKAARGTGHVIGVTGKTLGSAALHPQRTLMGPASGYADGRSG
ncbi:hypothetical protein NXY07_12645 [Phocaeicola dorei]|nr:hypothetical protein [Phocaeicola dorei]